MLTVNYKKNIIAPITYCFHNLNPEVAKYQKKVFDFFKLPLNQFSGGLSHGRFIDEIINSTNFDAYIIFDIDCIPLKNIIYDYLLIELFKEECIIGIEQTCNCNTSIGHIYAGPACFAITKNTYEKLGKPSFCENIRSDVAQELTHVCREKNIKTKFLKFGHANNKLWKLDNNRCFGFGSIYENGLIYHQFQITKNGQEFINKCKETIGEV